MNGIKHSVEIYFYFSPQIKVMPVTFISFLGMCNVCESQNSVKQQHNKGTLFWKIECGKCMYRNFGIFLELFFVN